MLTSNEKATILAALDFTSCDCVSYETREAAKQLAAKLRERGAGYYESKPAMVYEALVYHAFNNRTGGEYLKHSTNRTALLRDAKEYAYAHGYSGIEISRIWDNGECVFGHGSYEGSWVYTTNDQGKCPGWYDQYK